MGRTERQSRASSTVSSRAEPASSSVAPALPQVTLPSDLSGSLKYLDDVQLEKLLAAVTVEIDRRNQAAGNNQATAVAATGTSSRGQSAPVYRKKIRDSDEIPEGRVNLIRASFKAGIKPVTIARTFRMPQSLVNRVLSSVEKPKR
jgi:hypothetical protein